MTTDAQIVVEQYHRAWTARRFDQAIALLSPGLQVEVPINEYPTTEFFAKALVRFGSQVSSVRVLSQMSARDEAMLLYDMEVQGLGAMRMVEHFTVADGQIVRLRQIHDTAALRTAGFDSDTNTRLERHSTSVGLADAPGDEAEIVIDAPPWRVFEALTTLEGLRGWWTPLAKASETTAAMLEFGFAGLDEKIIMRVDEAVSPSSVVWTCLRHTGHPDWNGTKIFFQLDEHNTDTTVLAFRHVGLVPDLDCYDQCHAGWGHFLASLASYAARGQGAPFTAGPR